MKRKVYLTLLLVVCLCAVSCGRKKTLQMEIEPFEQHPTWTADSTNNFWE